MRNFLYLVVLSLLFTNLITAQPTSMKLAQQPFYFNPVFNVTTEYTFKAFLSNGQILEGKSQLYYKSGGAYIKLDGKIIKPTDTDSLLSNSLVGYPKINFWLFRVLKGKISGYCTYPDQNAKEYDYISKNNDIKFKYNLSNLKKLVSDNSKASSQLQQYKIGRTLMWGMLIGGAAIAISGFASFKQGVDSFSKEPGAPRVYLGGALVLGATIPNLLVRNKKEKAIIIYNK